MKDLHTLVTIEKSKNIHFEASKPVLLIYSQPEPPKINQSQQEPPKFHKDSAQVHQNQLEPTRASQ